MMMMMMMIDYNDKSTGFHHDNCMFRRAITFVVNDPQLTCAVLHTPKGMCPAASFGHILLSLYPL